MVSASMLHANLLGVVTLLHCHTPLCMKEWPRDMDELEFMSVDPQVFWEEHWDYAKILPQ